MNMPLSDNDTLSHLNDIIVQINRYLAPIILLYGFIGHVLNILILLQPTLRLNSSAWLLLVSSIAELLSICVGLLTRFLSGWNADLTLTTSWLCKLRAYTVFTARTMADWLLVLATVDQWLSSSRNPLYRRKSSLKNSKKSAKLLCFISLFLYLHMFYCYEANLVITPLKCYDKSLECRFVTDLLYGLITILLPIIFTTIFGLLTIGNVRKTQLRLQPQQQSASHTDLHHIRSHNNNSGQMPVQTRLKKKIDRRLIFVLAVRILLLIILTFPQAIQKLYSTFTIYFGDDPSNSSLNNLLYELLLLLTYISSGSTFYISIICGGKIFRDAFHNIPKFVCFR